MIVISGALVLAALVLLVLGLVAQELAFVYASIGVTLVSLAFLGVGVMQRRGEVLPGHEPLAPEPPVEDAARSDAEDPAPSPAAVLPTAATGLSSASGYGAGDDEDGR